MSTAEKIAMLPAGRRTKWLVLLFWVVILGVTGPLSGKLLEVQDNDTVN